MIYFNPLFVSPSNHKYDIQDYDNIDPHLGKIVSDEGELLPDGQRENRFASRYIDRVTNKANLEASNENVCPGGRGAPQRYESYWMIVFNHLWFL